MNYDRVQLKLSAKAAIRQARPNPRWVTLVFFLITAVLPSLVLSALSYFMLRNMAWQGAWISHDYYGYTGPVSGPFATLILFFTVLIALFALVILYGYTHYAMHVWREQESGYQDLFFGFSQVGRVLILALKMMLFSLLWALLGAALLSIAVLLCSILAFLVMAVLPSLGQLLSILLPLIPYVGFYVFFLSRILRYALAPFILLDKPSYRAGEALDESKDLMVGHRWQLFVLSLSFLGWWLLTLVLFSVASSVCILLFRGLSLHSDTLATLISWTISPLAALPLTLWLTPYIACSYVGFYESVAQNPGVPSSLLTRSEDPWER